MSVFVWRLEPTNPGHASMQIGSDYVSYWPSDAAGKNDAKLGSTHAASFPRSYATDRRIEGREADEHLKLANLDTGAMIESWRSFRLDPRRYNLIDHNCSTVIAALLELGSGRRPSFVPGVAIDDHTTSWPTRVFLRIRFLSRWIHMWTPDDVLRFALEIEPGARRP